MAGISVSELEASIRNALKGADLDSLSAKKIRRMLEEEFDTDLTSRKGEIDAMVMRLVTEAANGREDQSSGASEGEPSGEEEESNDSDTEKPTVPSPKKRKSEDTCKVKAKAPSKVKAKASVKESGVAATEALDHDNKKEDAKGMDDEVLAQQLQQEEINLRRRPAKKATRPRKQPAEKKERKGTSMYSRPCQLSQDLAAVMGTDKMSRHDVVKRMWEIVRERELQDPKNKQFMLCDAELQKIFGRKRVRMFGMMKTLKNHIRDVRDLTS